MSLLTIVEGPDGSGKSELVARFLAHGVAADAVSHGPRLDEGTPELFRRYLEPLRRLRVTREPLLFDRSWLSEPIYGAVKRRGSDRIGTVGRRFLERVALGLGAAVLLPATPFELCRSRFLAARKSGGEYLRNAAELRAVYDLYGQLASRTVLPVFQVDPRGDPLNLYRETLAERPRLDEGPGVGHWAPGRVTLLVGEQASDPACADVPFVSPDCRADNCAFWLTDALEQWGVRETELYWVNALDPARASLDPSFLERLKPRRVVALGKVAERWCRAVARVDHVAVDHPQYWKRFHPHEPYPLRLVLCPGQAPRPAPAAPSAGGAGYWGR